MGHYGGCPACLGRPGLLAEQLRACGDQCGQGRQGRHSQHSPMGTNVRSSLGLPTGRSVRVDAHPVNLQVIDATEVQLAVPTRVRYREGQHQCHLGSSSGAQVYTPSRPSWGLGPRARGSPLVPALCAQCVAHTPGLRARRRLNQSHGQGSPTRPLGSRRQEHLQSGRAGHLALHPPAQDRALREPSEMRLGHHQTPTHPPPAPAGSTARSAQPGNRGSPGCWRPLTTRRSSAEPAQLHPQPVGQLGRSPAHCGSAGSLALGHTAHAPPCSASLPPPSAPARMVSSCLLSTARSVLDAPRQSP